MLREIIVCIYYRNLKWQNKFLETTHFSYPLLFTGTWTLCFPFCSYHSYWKLTWRKLTAIRMREYEEMPPVNTSLRSRWSKNCFKTITSLGRTGNLFLNSLIRRAEFTPLLILKEMSTFTSVSLSVNFTIGTCGKVTML